MPVAREVEYTSEFEGWWNSLSGAEQEEIAAKVDCWRNAAQLFLVLTPM